MISPTDAARLSVREKPLDRDVVMYQRWRDLLFLHWEYDADEIQKNLPKGLYVDTFHGKAYLGIIPFFMRDVRPRFIPALPFISNFQELNFRTYVYNEEGIPGIWFFSLDANQLLAVESAKLFFKLPYVYTSMRAERNIRTGEIDYHSRRVRMPDTASSHFRYQQTGSIHCAEPGTLEFFLIERYVLYACDHQKKHLFMGKIHHKPYPLSQAIVSIWDAQLFGLNNFIMPDRQPDHTILSTGVDVEIFALEKTAASQRTRNPR